MLYHPYVNIHEIDKYTMECISTQRGKRERSGKVSEKNASGERQFRKHIYSNQMVFLIYIILSAPFHHSFWWLQWCNIVLIYSGSVSLPLSWNLIYIYFKSQWSNVDNRHVHLMANVVLYGPAVCYLWAKENIFRQTDFQYIAHCFVIWSAIEVFA